MTDKEVKKLKRQELLELLYYMRKELDETRLENERLTGLLDERSKEHEEVMAAIAKAERQLTKLVRGQKGENISENNAGGEVQGTKSQGNRKKRRRTQNSGQ